MRNIIQDVIDLDVFDEQGKLITQIKTIQKGALKYRFGNGTSSYLAVTDVLFNIDMLRIIGEAVEDNFANDFEKALQSSTEQVIKFKRGKPYPKLKLIGRGVIYDAETSVISHDFSLVMSDVRLVEGFEMELEAGEAFTPGYVFKLGSQDSEDSFELRLKERAK